MGKLILLFMISIILFFFISGCTELPEEKLNVTINATEIQEGQELTLLISSLNHKTSKINLEFGSEKITKICEKPEECLIEKKFIPKKGIYLLKVNAEGTNESFSQRIVISESTKNSCLDKTEFNTCSEKKPFYCNAGTIEKNCEKCGCSKGNYCENNECIAEAVIAKIKEINMPEKSPAEKEFTIELIIEGEQELIAGSKYELKLILGEQEKTEIHTITENKKETKISVNFEIPLGTHDLNLLLYSLPQKKLIDMYYKKEAISTISEIPDINPPIIQSIFTEGDDAIINWTKINGASEYRLYKSTNANPAYISYSLFKKFEPEVNSGSAQALTQGTHFFVITAVDYFGNESNYSNVKEAVINE